MIIYLDQNMWIELAKIHYGKNTNKKAIETLKNIKEAISQKRVKLPLSSIHYIESSRISNAGRRARLGNIMWELSQGYTFTSLESVAIHECEIALSQYFNNITVQPFDLIGQGVEFAFGMTHQTKFPPEIKNILERTFLTGEYNNENHKFYGTKYRKQFSEHLEKIKNLNSILPKDKLVDAIYAIVTMDISEPLYKALNSSNVRLEELGDNIKNFIDFMPSRAIEIHLHKQIIKNPTLPIKKSDLEDWAGLGFAVQYCDIVFCEGHFADLVQRDNFQTMAKVLTDITALNEILKS